MDQKEAPMKQNGQTQEVDKKRLKRLRIGKGSPGKPDMTMTAVAQVLNADGFTTVTSSYVAQWEDEKNPRKPATDMMPTLARLYRVPLTSLYKYRRGTKKPRSR